MSEQRRLLSSTREEETVTEVEDHRKVSYRVVYEVRTYEVTRTEYREETVRKWRSGYHVRGYHVRYYSERYNKIIEYDVEPYDVSGHYVTYHRKVPVEVTETVEERVEVERTPMTFRLQCAWIWKYQRGEEYITYQLKGVIFTNYAGLTHEDFHDIVTAHKDDWMVQMANPRYDGGYGHAPIEGPTHSMEQEEVEPDEVVLESGELDIRISCEDTSWEQFIETIPEEELYS